MKYVAKLISIVTILLLLSNLSQLKAEPLLRYTNKEYTYSILYPDNWEKKDINLHYKHVLILSRGLYIKIYISATKATPKEQIKWEHWQSWYASGTGQWSRRILESKKITLNKGITGKLIVIEYSTSRNRMLQRTLVANYKDKLLVIECKAPLKIFYTYQPIFDAVMSSIKVFD